MNTSRKSLHAEIVVCVALIVLVVVTWIGFALYFYEDVSIRSALAFMQYHKALGESPEFIPGAVNGLAQPLDVLFTWRQFQASIIIAMLLILGLMWLAFRLWRSEVSRQQSKI